MRVTRITHGDDTFIAYGPDPDHRRMYTLEDGYHRRTASMYWPSAAKFLHYGESHDLPDMSMAEILEEFGPQLGEREPSWALNSNPPRPPSIRR